MNMTGVQATGAGTSTYIRELMAGLCRVAPEDTITTFSYRRHFSRDRRILRSFDTLWHQSVWLNRTFPRQIRAQGIELLHNPDSIIPLHCPVPLVATIHDLYTFRNPSAFRLWHQTLSRFFVRQTLNRADRIIAISEFTRREIGEVFGSGYDDKITVVYEAAHPRFSPARLDVRKAATEKYQLDRPYVLCVSTIEPRKNLEGILAAFAQVCHRVDHDLVIVGGKGWKQEQLTQRVAELKLEGRVRFLGYVDLADLPALYSQADLFAYPSLYEGFGLPILEAMGCGCPVLTSDAASMSEVAGGAAVLVDPTRVDDMTEKLGATLLDESRRAELSQAGRIRAAEFSWDRCAEETLAIYRSMV